MEKVVGPWRITGRDVVASLLVVVVGGNMALGTLSSDVAMPVLLMIAGGYGLLSRRSEGKYAKRLGGGDG